MLQGEAGNISGSSSNLDIQMYTLREDISILLFARMFKGRVNQVEKKSILLTRKRKLTFHERESPIMFIGHWLLLANRK